MPLANHFHTTTCEKHAHRNLLAENHRPREALRKKGFVGQSFWRRGRQPGHGGRMLKIRGFAATGTASRGRREFSRDEVDEAVLSARPLAYARASSNKHAMRRAGGRCAGSGVVTRIAAGG